MSLAVQRLPSPNQGPRPAEMPTDMLILHYTGMQTAVAAVERLRDPQAAVSSHYVVDEDGSILCLVDEERRAAHAGISFWRGHEALNDRSIGIEIVNPGHEWGYRAFPEAQIDAVMVLCQGILGRHPIPPRNVVGHSDVAPDRKQDPGELFPWQRLAAAGIGVWPSETKDFSNLTPIEADEVDPLRRCLHAIGYRVAPAGPSDEFLRIVVAAFQRHWRPALVTGVADQGTLRVAQALRF